MLRSIVTLILCLVFREAEKLRCGVVTKDQWRLPRRNCWDSSGLDNGNPMSRSAAGHNSHTTGCNELILEVLKCRRGDLNFQALHESVTYRLYERIECLERIKRIQHTHSAHTSSRWLRTYHREPIY